VHLIIRQKELDVKMQELKHQHQAVELEKFKLVLERTIETIKLELESFRRVHESENESRDRAVHVEKKCDVCNHH
jgi:hypothetical protein